MIERSVFYRIGAIDRNSEIGFTYAQYKLEYIRTNLSKLIGCDVENYPLKILIGDCRNLKCFGVDASYILKGIFDEPIIES